MWMEVVCPEYRYNSCLNLGVVMAMGDLGESRALCPQYQTAWVIGASRGVYFKAKEIAKFQASVLIKIQ